MKIVLEIDSEKVVFNYKVGTSDCTATTPFNVDWLMALAQVLRLCHDAWTRSIQERTDRALNGPEKAGT